MPLSSSLVYGACAGRGHGPRDIFPSLWQVSDDAAKELLEAETAEVKKELAGLEVSRSSAVARDLGC